jgi:alginate export protein
MQSQFTRNRVTAAVLLALATVPAIAEDEAKPTPPPGLPAGVDWTFNLDATYGIFGFDNSLYLNPRPDDPSGNLGDNWSEGTVKAGLGGVYKNSGASEWYGKLSAVGEGTYSTAPDLVGGDATSFGVEDAYLGWRSGTSIGGGENVLDFKVGRAQYKLGHGMLLYDGASEGGSRGAYWTNARKAFEFAAVGTFKSGSNTFEVFYLDRDELPESDSGSKLTGANYEYAFGEDTVLGATYMKWSAKEDMRPERDGMEVYNLRAFTAPFPSLKALSFELEWAQEENDELIDSMAWNAAASWQFGGAWAPKLTYRYAFFEGDDPDTVENENFDGLFTGFYDWSTWWQGEIGGGYLLSNSNLISSQLRLHAKPTETISTGLIYLDFSLDHPESFAPGITSSDAGTELDWYMDWSVTSNFTMSFVLAIGEPGTAVEQFSGRTENFTYGMIYGGYSF